ncbi:hypothetical protein R3P38DRAFT_3211786 [Favolaschia claudopus]|uniref:Bacteriophage T5 Orf172 DNA-binding domain-containing protein n=1 Tax=Favolaschia claudopus TaxID=2862362 RepID=A0AAW0AGF0_9AGAR
MPLYYRPFFPHYPQHPPLTEPQRQLVRDDVARWPPEAKANYFLDWNHFHDRHGWIYALRQILFDPITGMFYEAIKYGLTSNLGRRMGQYDDCFPTDWMFAWPTSCVKLTEALIHARLRSRGLWVGLFDCSCGHSHREFFWGWGIGDVCREVEEVLWDTAQPIFRYWL